MALTKVYTNMIADTEISVQSYGAKGDGVTNNSADIANQSGSATTTGDAWNFFASYQATF